MADGLPYNGWSAHVRHGRDKHYYHARRRKILPQMPGCIGCRVCLPKDCISYHSEEYGPTLEDYWKSCVPMCHRCHAMLHARFATPNLWKRYLGQAVAGAIDDLEYPSSKAIAPMLARYRHREDIAFVPMPSAAPVYFRRLPLMEYAGPPKVATLLVLDPRTQSKVEVPDWTLYGLNLQDLAVEEASVLEKRGVNVREFLSGEFLLPTDRSGNPIYKRMYV